MTLLTDRYAFYLDHRRCGDLTSDVEGEPRQLAVGSGTDYWVFSYPGQGVVGANDREWCRKFREAVSTKYRGWLGECQPVGVKFLP